MLDLKKLEKSKKIKPYLPSTKEKILGNYIKKRRQEMQDYRRSLKVENEWKEADKEYIPQEMDFGTKRKRFETDQDTGLRSRMVPIGDMSQQWRSRNSDVVLLAKIQTALSLIIEHNPEATLVALTKRYESNTDLAYSLWKRNWDITNAKEIIKLFIFNLMKYGWAVGRSYPRIVKYSKEILSTVDTENPENNTYKTQENVLFNDIARQNLDPFRTWIDEMTQPYDPYSMNDCYYEIDYPYDLAEVEFSQYTNFSSVKEDSRIIYENEKREKNTDQIIRKDIVTIGFYENRIKDIYGIYTPKDNILLYGSPLLNDDGLLSLWHGMWILRDAKSPYGIGLWKIIKQDKSLYDKMINMTMDQLVLSIMKMFFYTGTSNILGDGKINIIPGKGQQIINGKVDWLNIPGPGKEAWEGLEFLKSKIDDSSGITPTIEGQITGKTLGEVSIARESALKRIRVPIDNIADSIQQDAYISLSWMKQVYSTPEIKDFVDEKELQDYEDANMIEHHQVFPQENGLTASFLPQLSLHLEDRNGQLFESKESRFFQVGKEIKNLDWRGIFKVIPKSLFADSSAMKIQRKNEIFNILVPILQFPPELYSKSAIQLLKANEEDPQDWLPDSWIQETQKPSLFVPAGGGGETAGGLPPVPSTMSIQSQAGTTPNKGGQTILPQNLAQPTQVPGMNQQINLPNQ